jgi:broad specificity phosphatase PhoE
MLRLFLLRHGETDYNLQKIVQGGGIDSDLNVTGYLQGEMFYDRYRSARFDAIYCSGLKRTRQTLHGFEADGRAIHPLPGLNEMGWGELEGKPFDPVSHAAFLEMNARWAQGELDLAFPGGESPRAVWERTSAAIREIESRHAEGNILICTHGRTLRILLSGLGGYGIERMNWFPHENTGLNILRRPDNTWQFEKINCLQHLAG